MFGGNVTNAVIDDLVTESEYAVSVAGLTIDEELEKVGPVLVTTCKCPFNILIFSNLTGSRFYKRIILTMYSYKKVALFLHTSVVLIKFR